MIKGAVRSLQTPPCIILNGARTPKVKSVCSVPPKKKNSLNFEYFTYVYTMHPINMSKLAMTINIVKLHIENVGQKVNFHMSQKFSYLTGLG